MQPIEIEQLQNLSDLAYSYVKSSVIKLKNKGLSYSQIKSITGLDSTRQQRILKGCLGEMNSRFLIRACSGLNEYYSSNPKTVISKKSNKFNP